jgi:shikimate kinase
VLNPENLRLSRTNGFIISLLARPEVIYERTKHETNRPLLCGADPLFEIRRIMAERESLYQDADLLVDTSRGTPVELIGGVIEELIKRGIVHGRG